MVKNSGIFRFFQGFFSLWMLSITAIGRPVFAQSSPAELAARYYAEQLYGDVEFVSEKPGYNLQGTVEVSMFLFRSTAVSGLSSDGDAYMDEFSDYKHAYVTIIAGANETQPPVICGYRGLPHYMTHLKAIRAVLDQSGYQHFKTNRIIYLGYGNLYYEIIPESQTEAPLLPEQGIHFYSHELVTFQNLGHSTALEQKKSFHDQWQRFKMEPFGVDSALVEKSKKRVSVSSSLTLDDRANLKPFYLEEAEDLIVFSNTVNPLVDGDIYENNAIKIWFGLINAGNTTISQDYSVDFYINDVLVYTYHPWFDLGAQQSLLWFFQYTFAYQGQYFIKMVVDASDIVDETDETDNIYERTVYVQQWDVDETILDGIPGYNQITNDCAPVSAAKVLAYWDDHPYQGQIYWNLVDHGNSETGDLSPIEADTSRTGLVYDLRIASRWTRIKGTFLDSLALGIEAVCNSPEYKNNLMFTAELTTDPDYEKMKEQILQSKPLIYAVQDHYYYGNHSMSAIGYRQTPLDRVIWVKDNLNGDEKVWLNWDNNNNSIITITPGGTPQDAYENDNTPETASPIDPGDKHLFRQTHNFYAPGDVDCVRFRVFPFRHYSIVTQAAEEACDTQIILHTKNDTLIINDDYKTTNQSRIDWFVQVPPDTIAYVSIFEKANRWGPQTNYDIEITYSDLPDYYVETSASPLMAGRIDLDPDTLIFDKNASVQAHAVSDTGYVFHHWEGSLSGQLNPQQLQMIMPQDITAYFAETHPFVSISALAQSNASEACAWGDYDADGDLDLFIANDEGQKNELYRNKGNGELERLQNNVIVRDSYSSSGGCWGDFDRDGDLDLFVSNKNGINNQLFKNMGFSLFVEITEGDIVNNGGSSTQACWADYDNDGNIDLFVANKSGENNFLYRNKGKGEFERIVNGAIVNDGGDSRSAAWGDFDNDNDMDLFVANTQGQANFLYQNNGDGTFTALTDNPIVTDKNYSWSGNWVDYDNDNDLDLFVVNANENHYLYQNTGGRFQRIEGFSITETPSLARGSGWADFDCDGDLDVFINNRSQGSQLFLNNGDGFEPYYTGFSDARGGAWQDADNDGDMDLYITQYGSENLMVRNTISDMQWLKVKVTGYISNKNSVGARVRIKAEIAGNPLWQMREITSQQGTGGQGGYTIHFGLGDAKQVDSLVVQWPCGRQQIRTELACNQFVTLYEPKGNQNPVAQDDTFFVNSKDSLTLSVLDNDSDPDEDYLRIICVDTTRTLGVLKINQGSTTITFWPAANFEGWDDFQYIISDGLGGLDTATVLISNGTATTSEHVLLPRHAMLFPNYPNPFNPVTTIAYQTAQPGNVNITIYNTAGHAVITLVNTWQPAGYYEVQWNGQDKNDHPVASGVYIYRFHTSSITKTRKMLFVR